MTDQEQNNPRRVSRRATIMRGVVTPVFGLLAVACFVFGILNATEWKPNAQVQAVAFADSRYVVTDPGVLSVVDDQVSLTVTSPSADNKVCVVSGLPHDIAGWIAGLPYTRLTGLSSWTELSTADAKAAGSSELPENPVAIDQSDMWQSVDCGTGSVHIDRSASASGSTEILIDGNADAAADDDSSQPVQVSMHWTRQTLPDYATPLYFIGGLLVVAAVLSASLFAVHPSKRRKNGVGDDAAEPVSAHEEITVTIPSLMFGAIGGFFGALASMLHIGKAKPRRHARRAARSAESHAAVESTPSQPTVVDVTARNMVAQTAAAAASQDEGQHVTLGPVSAEQREADGEAEQDNEPTSVISMDELNAYIARLNAENAASAQDADAQSGDGESKEHEDKEDQA